MVAGTISDSLFGGGVLAYSALNRVKGKQETQVVVIRAADRLPPDSGVEDLVGLIRIDGDYTDFWGGLTYSHRLGSHLGLGLTLYGASRSQTRRSATVRQTVDVDGSGRTDLDISGGSHNTIRTLAKVGVFGKFGAVTGGLSLTSPSLHIYGRGQLGTNQSSVGVDSTSLAATFETGLTATYRTPLSVGVGVGLPIGPARLYASHQV